MIRDYHQIQFGSPSSDVDMSHLNSLTDECERRRIQYLLQRMRVLNEKQTTQFTNHHALLIELLSMHLLTPFEHIELFAGREGQKESKAAYRVAQNWCRRGQAREAVLNAGQTIRYFCKIPLEQLTEFYVVAVYQASLCLWVYGIFTNPNDSDLTQGDASIESTICVLNTDESVETYKWMKLNCGIPTIRKAGINNEAGDDGYIPLSSTQEMVLYLRNMLQFKVLKCKVDPLTSAICDLMSALSAVRPEMVISWPG
ncbi:hypothetical protein ZTR_06961 [Talaromyces verruculosus]|nr:hypothetical protein ZTR_06961 [Talaromyces verruculosus]